MSKATDGGGRREAPEFVLNAKEPAASPGRVLLQEVAKAKSADVDRAQLVRLLRWQRQSLARILLPEARVAKCYRVRVKPCVQVNYSKRVKRAHYGGLMTCASVWDDPVCSAKITERRRAELESVDLVALGLCSFMATFTLRHTRSEKCKVVSAELARAFTKLKNARAWSRFAKRWQIVASLTGTELTYGLANGWHPHKHVLFWSKLARSAIDPQALRDEMSIMFESILAKQHRYASPIHGVDVQLGDDLVAQYVAKFGHEPKVAPTWSLAAEITKGTAKTHMLGEQHYTPFQLLDLYGAGDAHAGALFREYAIAMFHHPQLRWSRGGREALDLVAVAPTDEELAAAVEEDAELLALLSADDWRQVLKHNMRGHLLEVASSGNYSKLITFMRAIGAKDFGKS